MSKFKIKKKMTPVMEDDTTDNNQQNNSSTQANSQNDALNQQKAMLVTKLADIEKKYLDDKKNIITQIAQVDAKIAQSGGKVEISESSEVQNRVNESASYGKQAELSRLIEDSFSNIEDKLSYWPSSKDIEDGFYNKIARSIISYINSKGYNITDTVNHSNDIKDAIGSYFKNSKVNYSEKEISMIHDALIDTIDKTENGFKWLIKNKE